MVPTAGPSIRTSFGVYEVDLQTGELWKAGRRIKQVAYLKEELQHHGDRHIYREKRQARFRLSRRKLGGRTTTDG